MIDNKALSTTGVGSTTRYEVLTKIATGGMASVYLGAMKGPFGFEQLVAIKRLHQHLVDEPDVRESLLVEARVAARIRHTNVVDVRDVEVIDGTIQLVMTYVEGASLAQLMTLANKLPVKVTLRIVLDSCAGLHAAHQLTDEHGRHLGVVHRDISPQNILVGIDGTARITDFGVARDETIHRLRTKTGHLKGKFAYMAPEYIFGQKLDRRADVFALGVVCWEALAGKRLFKGTNEADTIRLVTTKAVPPIGHTLPGLEGIDAVLAMALSKDPNTRFSSAEAFGAALEALAIKSNSLATPAEVAQHVRKVAREDLERLAEARRTASERISASIEPSKSVDLPMSTATVISPPPAGLIEKSKLESPLSLHDAQTPVARASPELSDPTTRRSKLNLDKEEQPETLDAPTPPMGGPETLPACEPSFRHPAMAHELTPAVPVLSAVAVPVVDRPSHASAWGALGPKGTFVMPNGHRRDPNPPAMTMRSPSAPEIGVERVSSPDSAASDPMKSSLEACLHDSPKRWVNPNGTAKTLAVPTIQSKLPIMPFKSAPVSVARRRVLFIVAVCVLLATSLIVTCVMLIGSNNPHSNQTNFSE